MSPFFRIPGLARNDAIEEYARRKGPADLERGFRRRRLAPRLLGARVYDLAMSRLAAKGKGILLLHDIQPRTVAALPKILAGSEGARLSHRPRRAGDRGELPATPTEPQQWLLQSELAEAVATAALAENSELRLRAARAAARAAAHRFLLERHQAARSSRNGAAAAHSAAPAGAVAEGGAARIVDTASALPAPAASVFEVGEGLGVVMLGVNATRPAERRAAVETEPKKAAQVAERKKPSRSARGQKAPAQRCPQRQASAAVAHARGKPAAKSALYRNPSQAAAQSGRPRPRASTPHGR